MIKKNKKMNDAPRKRKLPIAVALVIFVILTISTAIYVFYLHESRKYEMKKMETFNISIENVSSLGQIDHIEFVICEQKTLIESYKDHDGTVLWIEKIVTPQQLRTLEGQSCAVEIRVTKERKTTNYQADQLFDCPDCSGLHYYEIVEDKAVYRYSP